MDRKIPSGYDIGDNGSYRYVLYYEPEPGGSGVAKSLANSAKDVGLYRSMTTSPDVELYTGAAAEHYVYMRAH